MPTEPTYEPRIGSLAYRFIKHMQAPERAGQHMTRSQIVRQFDVPSSAIDALLQTPTVNGALTKERNSAMEVCWRLSDAPRIHLREAQPLERTPAAPVEPTGDAMPPAVAAVASRTIAAFWLPGSPSIGLPPMPGPRVPRQESRAPAPAPTPAPKPVQRAVPPAPAPRAPVPPPPAASSTYLIAAFAYEAPIRRGVPLVDVHQQRAKKYASWLAGFQAGDSAEFARTETDEVIKAVAAMEAVFPTWRFRVATTGQQTAGIERAA